jgi:hypothetical protein
MKRTDRCGRQARAASNDGDITRRDFLNGCPIAVGGAIAAGLLPEFAAKALAGPPAQDAPGYDPPALTGLRGNHVGSFEIAHRLRNGDFWSRARPVDSLDETYDLVVVGAASAGLRRRISIAPDRKTRGFSSSTITMISVVTPSAMNSDSAAACS